MSFHLLRSRGSRIAAQRLGSSGRSISCDARDNFEDVWRGETKRRKINLKSREAKVQPVFCVSFTVIALVLIDD